MANRDRFIGLAHKYVGLGIKVLYLVFLLYKLVSVVTNYPRVTFSRV